MLLNCIQNYINNSEGIDFKMEEKRRFKVYKIIMLVVLVSFITFLVTSIGMYKYFTDYLLPKRENIDFYEDVDEILRVFMDTNFANASPMIMRELCLKSAMNVAYQYVG